VLGERKQKIAAAPGDLVAGPGSFIPVFVVRAPDGCTQSKVTSASEEKQNVCRSRHKAEESTALGNHTVVLAAVYARP